MSEVVRSDSRNLDVYIDYLNKNGLIPKDNLLHSVVDVNKKNVAGLHVNEIPAISEASIFLNDGMLNNKER